MRRLTVGALILFLVAFLQVNTALAADWAPPISPPPGYNNLTYVYNEGAFFQFYLTNPFELEKYNQNYWNDADIISPGQFPPESRFAADLLFAPDNRVNGHLVLGNGYGFVDPNNRTAPPPSDLIYWLKALEWPMTGNYYNVTDAGQKQGGTAVRKIFYHMPFGTSFYATPDPTNASNLNPLLKEQAAHDGPFAIYDVINNGQYSFNAMAYDNSLPEIGGKMNFIYFFNFTRDAAIGFLHRVYTISQSTFGSSVRIAEIGCELKKVAFTIDLSVEQLTTTAPDASGEATFGAVVKNLSPFNCERAVFRLYTWPDGDQQPTLVFQQELSLDRAQVASGIPGSRTVYGKYPAPGKNYKLIATINAVYSSSGIISVPGVPGRWSGDFYRPTFEGRTPPGLGAAITEPYYSNNVTTTGLQQGWQPPDTGGNTGPDDLAVTGVQVLDAQTGQPVSSPQANQPLKIKANFVSTFNVGGWAKLRLYRYQVEYKRLDLVDSVNVYFEPHGTYTKEWGNYTVGVGQYKFVVSIDYYNNGNDPSTGWQAEKFDGKYDEKTYDNNKKEASLTGTEQPPRRPEPRQVSQPVWYPPVMWKETPIYQEFTEPIYGWKKVTFRKEEANGKVRVRLVQ